MLDKLQHVTERRNKVYMFLKFDRPDWLKYWAHACMFVGLDPYLGSCVHGRNCEKKSQIRNEKYQRFSMLAKTH